MLSLTPTALYELAAPHTPPEVQAEVAAGERRRLSRDSKPLADSQPTAIMTSEALITTVTWPLALMPRSSTASLVIEEVIIWPLPISTRTWEVVAPFVTSTTAPWIWLRALMRVWVPRSRGSIAHHRRTS